MVDKLTKKQADLVLRGNWGEWKQYLQLLRNPQPALEPYILQDPHRAYFYSLYILRNMRQDMAEVILKAADPWVAYLYAENVIRGPWPEAEPVIAKDPHSALQYARYALRGRFEAAEPNLMQSGLNIYEYARCVLRRRWKEAEPNLLAGEPEYIFKYTKRFFRGRWSEAEARLVQVPEWSVDYARDIIKGPWPEAEPYLLEKIQYGIVYVRDVLRQPWPELEARIDNEDLAQYYAQALKWGQAGMTKPPA
jgi:hypothetical protein